MGLGAVAGFFWLSANRLGQISEEVYKESNDMEDEKHFDPVMELHPNVVMFNNLHFDQKVILNILSDSPKLAPTEIVSASGGKLHKSYIAVQVSELYNKGLVDSYTANGTIPRKVFYLTRKGVDIHYAGTGVWNTNGEF